MGNDVILKKGMFGYNSKKVAEYIDNLSENFNNALDEKDKKISLLEGEVSELKKSLSALEAEKESIANSLISAQNESKKIIDEANKDAYRLKIQAEVELENTLSKISDAKDELTKLKAKTLDFVNEYKELITSFADAGSKNEN